uniref:Secreted protein n=1 Tax=Strigamia maritima TaxID=126957 RepID=T1IWK1_STRMM
MHCFEAMKCLLTLLYIVQAENCDPRPALFELITGHVLISPSAIIESQPETLTLEDCLAA